jgi:predicted nuclease with TOPRIM domain
MQEQIQQRLENLRAEFAAGQKMLADLDAKRANLEQTLLRISGAVQVLEEVLNVAAEPTTNGTVTQEALMHASPITA